MRNFLRVITTCFMVSAVLVVGSIGAIALLIVGALLLLVTCNAPYDLSPSETAKELAQVRQRLAEPPNYLKRELLEKMPLEQTGYQAAGKITHYNFRYIDPEKHQNASIHVSMGSILGGVESVTFEPDVPPRQPAEPVTE